MNGAIQQALKSLGNGRDLGLDESYAAVTEILGGDAPEVLIGSFLTALRFKGETAEELAGAVKAVRARVERAGLSIPREGVIDTCGTGGDGANSLNVSTAAAIVVAAAGGKVAKHGNRSASGNSGSAEVLSELGIAIEATPERLSKGFDELGIAFLFAPKFHPGMRFAGPVRKQLPFRTMFNLVGPLANPTEPEYQLVGVAGDRAAHIVAGALSQLGLKRAAVVTGAGGLDEISLQGATRVLLVEAGQVETLEWEPSDFGFPTQSNDELRVTGPAESADRIRRLFGGERGAARDVVLANAAGALWTSGVSDLKVAVQKGAEAIDSGRASELLERWRAI